jgi:predicted glycoside hydrolase/deacetylase ChbG (UPF0249 family)
MTSSRRLIVNADDFGLSPGVNAGIIEAHKNGIVTSTSLMVHAPAAQAAAEIAVRNPELSVGIHLDLGEWRFVNGEWEPVYERAPLDDVTMLEREVEIQLEKFVALVGSSPTHIDSHQHAHRNEPLRSVVLGKSADLGVPVRHFTPGIVYRGDFYGQDDEGKPYPEHVTAVFLAQLINSLPEGTTELCCHPAFEIDFQSTYAMERDRELAALCDPSVRAAVDAADVALIGFASINPNQ